MRGTYTNKYARIVRAKLGAGAEFSEGKEKGYTASVRVGESLTEAVREAEREAASASLMRVAAISSCGRSSMSAAL